jgi:phosphoenolpyruvate phosphomutase
MGVLIAEGSERSGFDPSAKSRRLRSLMRGTSIVRMVGAADCLTAKLVQDAGFEAVWVSSFELSASRGLPDASLVTMSQYLDAAEDIDCGTDLPVVADCDTGFGGPMNVAYAVRRYERRGIAALCVEDKRFPKLNSFADAAQELVSAEEFAEKIVAAKQAQSSPDSVFIARTEALIAGRGMDEAVKRAHIYADAGADAILVHSKSTSPEEILEFGSRWDRGIPLVAVPTTYTEVDESVLFAAGYRLVIYANQTLRSQVLATRGVLAELSRAGRAAAVEDRITSMGEVFKLQGMPVAYRPGA